MASFLSFIRVVKRFSKLDSVQNEAISEVVQAFDLNGELKDLQITLERTFRKNVRFQTGQTSV